MRHYQTFARAATAALLALASAPPAGAQLTAVITADNAYRIGFGPAGGPVGFLPAVENTTAGAIFNCSGGPESYTFSPGVADFLYIVAYSDDAVSQGVLGKFSLAGGRTITTGGPGWQVFATGRDRDPGTGGVSNNDALTAITVADASNGWQGVGTPGLAVGEPNTAGGTFPAVCNIAAGARWMWYASRAGINPFSQNPPGGAGHREFLVFRLPVRALMCSCRPGERELDAAASVGRGRALEADSSARPPPETPIRPVRPFE